MPLNSAPKFVVSSNNSHNYTSNNNSQQHQQNNNNNGGKLLICLRDLSKFRDQTLKSPSGHGAQTDPSRSKSSPSFRNSAESTGAQKLSPDYKSISAVIKKETTESSTSAQDGSHAKQHSSADDRRTSPQSGFDPQAAESTDECGLGVVSPKSEITDDSKKGTEDGLGSSPGGDDPTRDADPAKQLNKLKRFLSTLQQFANDISKEIGDCVQTLIYWLVHAKISVEDFHQRLQQATNFPLRPFVVPFLKANLPLLQMELLQHSNRYSPNSLLHPQTLPKNSPTVASFGLSLPSRHQHFLPPPPLTDLPPLLIPFSGALNLSNGSLAGSNGFPGDVGRMDVDRGHYFHREVNGNGKRMSPDRSPHSSSSVLSSSSSSSSSSSLMSFQRHPFKKRRSSSPHAPLMLTSSSESSIASLRSDLYKTQIKTLHDSTNEQRNDTDKSRIVEAAPSFNVMLSSAWERFEERSSQIENLLLTLLNVADKCSQKMTSLKAQTRLDFERITAHVIKDVTEQRLTSDDYLQKMDVKMKTEKVVHEVKQQALMEMQRAVAAAEAKASLTVANERMRLERVVEDARKQAKQEILDVLNRQEESNENCWNCGRLASETCSGCNEARYCGLFCQHKDWESHHKVCRQVQERSADVQGKTLPHGAPRGLLHPTEGLPPWSMVPSFLMGRNPFLVSSRHQKSDKDGPSEQRKTPAIKTERQDTPPATDVNSNVISSSAEKKPTSDLGDRPAGCNSPAKKEDKKEKNKADGKWTNDSP